MACAQLPRSLLLYFMSMGYIGLNYTLANANF